MANLEQALKYLRDNPVKRGDPVEAAARSERMNALRDAILSLARSEHVRKGPGILIKASLGSLIISSTADGGGGGGSDESVHPFKVSATVKDEYTAIQVYPGLIQNQVPYIDGQLMTALVFDGQGQLVPNTFTPPATDFSVWLITRIKTEGNGYHPRIDIPLAGEDPGVLPPAESCYITHVAPAEEDRIDFRVKWDDDEERTNGGFPIRIADVKLAPAPPGDLTGPKVSAITQYVFTNWRSLVLMGDDIIPLA